MAYGYRYMRSRGMSRWKSFRGASRLYGGRMRSRFTRKNAIASTPYIAGAAVGFTGIADSYIPAQFQNVLMIAAVAPSGLMKGKALGTLKAVAQGYIIGRVVKGITGFGGINTSSGMSGGPWL